MAVPFGGSATMGNVIPPCRQLESWDRDVRANARIKDGLLRRGNKESLVDNQACMSRRDSRMTVRRALSGGKQRGEGAKRQMGCISIARRRWRCCSVAARARRSDRPAVHASFDSGGARGGSTGASRADGRERGRCTARVDAARPAGDADGRAGDAIERFGAARNVPRAGVGSHGTWAPCWRDSAARRGAAPMRARASGHFARHLARHAARQGSPGRRRARRFGRACERRRVDGGVWAAACGGCWRDWVGRWPAIWERSADAHPWARRRPSAQRTRTRAASRRSGSA
jgi:hypothetical protein